MKTSDSQDATSGEYLGDGVHATCDGWHIWLTAERGGTNHQIALHPGVFDALLEYRRKIFDRDDPKETRAESAARRAPEGAAAWIKTLETALTASRRRNVEARELLGALQRYVNDDLSCAPRPRADGEGLIARISAWLGADKR